MKVGDLVAFKLEVKDRKRSNVRYRNPLGLGLVMKSDPAGCMFLIHWANSRGWHTSETVEVINENR